MLKYSEPLHLKNEKLFVVLYSQRVGVSLKMKAFENMIAQHVPHEEATFNRCLIQLITVYTTIISQGISDHTR